jgi:hypothetical protein
MYLSRLCQLNPTPQTLFNKTGRQWRGDFLPPPIEEFQELLADLNDLAIIATRMNEPSQSLSSLKAEFSA